jgi:hypothetical protein
LNPKKNGKKKKKSFPFFLNCYLFSLNISGNLSNLTTASNTTFETSSYPSRKRPRYEVDDQPPINTQLLDGINIIDDESAHPKFVKLVNNSKQNLALNGHVLKRKVGSQTYEFKFPKGMNLKAGATTTVRDKFQDFYD